MEEDYKDSKKLHQYLWNCLDSYPDKDSIDPDYVLSFEFDSNYTYSIKFSDLKKSIEENEG